VHLTIATAGHIDHGKSALVQALTGTNPDRLKEEQARGISIELGFAHTRVGDTVLSFVDVPGHERFVRTMLAGVGGIDAVLFVVAADESVMPQTREHLDICTLLDVPRGVVALTKCDAADETLQAIAEAEVRDLVAGTPLRDAPVVRVSARTGLGLDELRGALLGQADTRRPRDDAGPVRLPIDRVFSVKGFGTVVTGTLWCGTLQVDAQVTVIGAGGRETVARTRGLQVHGAPAGRAEAGQRVAVNLAGLSLDEIARGDLLVGDGAVLVSNRLSVRVRVLPDAPPQKHGTRLHVHLGTTSVLGRLLVPAGPDDDGSREIAAGDQRQARLRLESPLPVRRGDRLVLRAYSPVATIAGAVVDDPKPPARVVAAPGGVDRSPTDWLAQRIDEAAGAGVAVADVAARCGVSAAMAVTLTTSLVEAGRIVRAGDHWLSATLVSQLTADVLAKIAAARDANRWGGGVSRAELRQAFARRYRPAFVDMVLDRLEQSGEIAGDARLTSGTQPPGPGEDAEVRDVLEFVRAAGLKGHTAAELEASVAGRLDRKALAAILARQVKAAQIERMGDLYVAREALDELVKGLRSEAEQGQVPARLDIGWFKERYALTRRTAIPLLEWLDRARVTRRDGDARVLLVGK
jgi:selenocysteine-specific elongation factor